MSDETFDDAFKAYREQSGNGSDVETVVIPNFVCTKCRIRFEGEDASGMKATCPECGGNYDGFFTPLIRCGTFALAYWLDAEPGEIRKHESAV